MGTSKLNADDGAAKDYHAIQGKGEEI